MCRYAYRQHAVGGGVGGCLNPSNKCCAYSQQWVSFQNSLHEKHMFLTLPTLLKWKWDFLDFRVKRVGCLGKIIEKIGREGWFKI